MQQSTIYASILASYRSQNSQEKRETEVRARYHVHPQSQVRDRRTTLSRTVNDRTYSSRADAGYDSYPTQEEAIYLDVASPSSQSKVSPTDPNGYRDLLLQESFDLVERKIQDFQEMDRKATDLAAEVNTISALSCRTAFVAALTYTS